MFKNKHLFFPNLIKKHNNQKKEEIPPYSVKYEGFYQKTEVKSFDTEEDGEEAIRVFLHDKTVKNSLLTNFYENDRVAEISDPDGNDWYCCTRLWVP